MATVKKQRHPGIPKEYPGTHKNILIRSRVLRPGMTILIVGI